MMRLRYLVLASALAAFVVGCAAPVSRQAGGGMSGTGSPMVTIGTVTRFGSVVVNGFVWDTSSAEVSVNGRPAEPARDLRLGMVVRVDGERSSSESAGGKARTLVYEADLIGPIDALLPEQSASGGSSGTGITALRVAGQAVHTGRGTRWENPDSDAQLAAGDWLEISGFRDSAGELHATWIRRLPKMAAATDGEVRIKGLVRATGTDGFFLGDIRVLSSLAAKPGDFVAVTGVLAAGDRTLRPRRAERLPTAVALPENVPVIMEGFVRDVNPSGFVMHNRPIRVGQGTSFENGTAADLHQDGKVHVFGIFKRGTMSATRIILSRAD